MSSLSRLSRPLATFVVCGSLLGAAGLLSSSWAQTSPVSGNSKPTREPGNTGGTPWSGLTPAQRQALAPLAATWNTLSSPQQRKWLEVSRNYPALALPDQVKMHGRMAEWVGLSARERAAARLNFAATTEFAKELSPEEKKAKWQAYQALSPDERKKLAEQGSRPRVGAAPAARPVSAQKLATLPTTPGKGAALPATPVMPAMPATPASPAEAASTAAAPAERVER